MDRRTQQAHASTSQTGSRFSPQQVTILAVVGVLNILLIVLGVYAWRLMQSPQSSAPVPMPASAELPTQTSMPGVAAVGTTDNPVPPLPPECAWQAQEAQQGTVTRVIDGNTLEVSINGVTVLAGFAGIEPRADFALELVRGVAEGQTVTLVKDTTEQDASGRLARYVFSGGRFLNYELVRLGLASVQPDSPDRACAGLFQQAEQQARAEKIGVWKPAPVPTATFIPFVTLDPGTNGACDCSVRHECSDFSTHDEAQACYNLCNDYSSKLDEDRDGLACEFLP